MKWFENRKDIYNSGYNQALYDVEQIVLRFSKSKKEKNKMSSAFRTIDLMLKK